MADMLEHYLPEPMIPPAVGGEIEELSDPAEIQQFLLADRYAHAYLLGYLKPAYYQWCRWYGARRADGQLGSLVCLYLGLSIPVVFVVGASERYETFLRRCLSILPVPFHFHVLDQQMDTFEEVFTVGPYKQMLRLGLGRDRYTGFGADPRVRRLGHRDTAAIMELFAHYPDHFFEPYQLESRLYVGIDHPEEPHRLLSMAGIHTVSQDHDVAVIGNIVTHPEHRGQGMARCCVSNLLDALFEQVSYVALNVQSDNAPAIELFESFGFAANNIFFEGRCIDK